MRWIAPHAIAFDGFRWHARAWSHERREFRDFVMARMLTIAEDQPAAVDGSADAEWQRRVTLRIAPNPALPLGQRRAIQFATACPTGNSGLRLASPKSSTSRLSTASTSPRAQFRRSDSKSCCSIVGKSLMRRLKRSGQREQHSPSAAYGHR